VRIAARLFGVWILPVSGLFLLLKNKSTFATIASVLLWPYFFWLALITRDRFFYYGTSLRMTVYFVCFLSPALFALAAGLLRYRPTFAHAMTIVAGVLGLPWIYWTELRNSELTNPWIMFNAPDEQIRMFPLLHAKLTILAVALIVLANVTAVLRLLPSHWQLRKSSLSERTWPAYCASFFVLVVWFSQSVMPYRIRVGGFPKGVFLIRAFCYFDSCSSRTSES
jgi:hypothetical protein